MATIKKNWLERVMQKSVQESKISGAYKQLNDKKRHYTRFRYEPNTIKDVIAPLSLALPFNPNDVDDTTYSNNNRFFIPTSVESAWELIKMKVDEEAEKNEGVSVIREYLEDYLEVSLRDFKDIPLKEDKVSAIDRFSMLAEKLGKLCVDVCTDKKKKEDLVADVKIDESKTLDEQWNEIKAQLCKIYDTNLDHLKLVNGQILINYWDAKGKALANVLKDLRKIEPKGAWVCKINLSSINENPVKHSIEVKKDADGNNHFTGLLYKLSCLERDIIAPEMKEVNDKLKRGGVWSGYSKEQKSAARKNVTSKACIGTPTFYSFITALEIIRDGDGIEADCLKRINDRGIASTSTYIPADKGMIDMFSSKLGGKYDKTPSYVQCRFEIGGEDDALTRMQHTMKAIAEMDVVSDLIKDFDAKYREFRDDINENSDEALIKSVREISRIDDAVLLEAYQSHIANYSRDVYTKEVVVKNADVLAAVDEKLARSLKEELAADLLRETNIREEDIGTFAKFQKETSTGESVDADANGNEIDVDKDEDISKDIGNLMGGELGEDFNIPTV